MNGSCPGLRFRGQCILSENPTIMSIHTLLLATSIALLGATTPATSPVSSTNGVAVGAPPAVRIAGKANGDITAAQWNEVRQVEIVGCVPGARIVNLHICVKDCEGQNAGYNTKSSTLTEGMRALVKNLPAGTPFTVTATVNDNSGQVWKVPPARFVWKG